MTCAINEGTVTGAERDRADVNSIDVGSYTVCINLGAKLQTGVYGRQELAIPPGAGFLDAQETFTIGCGIDYSRWAALSIPHTLANADYSRIDARQGLSISAGSEALRLMRSYMEMLDGDLAPESPLVVEHISRTMIDLFALAVGVKGDEAELAGLRGLRAARLQAVLDDLQRNYSLPRYCARDVGRHLGLSERYVQDLLAATGVSLSERLLELRLQHARKLLSAEGARKLRIADIVYDSGFGDVSYFNRCFRRRFGCNPGSTR